MKREIIEFNKSQKTKKMPDFQAGDVVKTHMKIREGGKERVQIFLGIVIAIKGKQSSSPMITVRKISHGVGVELILPVFSPNIEKIELIKRAKVRRSKLYYIRNLTAKQSRMKYKDLREFIKEEAEPVIAETKVEEETQEVTAIKEKKAEK